MPGWLLESSCLPYWAASESPKSTCVQHSNLNFLTTSPSIPHISRHYPHHHSPKPQDVSINNSQTILGSMARQSTRPRKHDRTASPHVSRKSPRLPKRPGKTTVTRIISSPAAERSAVKDPRRSKTRQTVSAASIFKKQPKSDRRSKKHRKQREVTPEPTLLDDYQCMAPSVSCCAGANG